MTGCWRANRCGRFEVRPVFQSTLRRWKQQALIDVGRKQGYLRASVRPRQTGHHDQVLGKMSDTDPLRHVHEEYPRIALFDGSVAIPGQTHALASACVSQFGVGLGGRPLRAARQRGHARRSSLPYTDRRCRGTSRHARCPNPTALYGPMFDGGLQWTGIRARTQSTADRPNIVGRKPAKGPSTSSPVRPRRDSPLGP